jgi:hypothetical protein
MQSAAREVRTKRIRDIRTTQASRTAEVGQGLFSPGYTRQLARVTLQRLRQPAQSLWRWHVLTNLISLDRPLGDPDRLGQVEP